MSTETKPLKLMPHVKRTAANGRVYIEPGDRSEFELPAEFHPLFQTLESGASLSKLVDQIDPKKAGSRFRLIRKFLIFLDENDLLADRDYMRLAESLKPEYSWPTSILSTELSELTLVKSSKRAGSRWLTNLLLLVTVGLALGSLAFIATASANEGESSSAVRAVVLFLVTMSIARSAQAIWAFLTSFIAGSVARLDLVIELLAIRFRQEQLGRAVRLSALISNALSFLTMFGVAAFATRFARSGFEFDVVVMAGAFAFFTETSPYSRTSLTDLLRSLYASLEERASESGMRERAIRNVHITACVAWVLFVGLFFVIDVPHVAGQALSLLKGSRGGEKIALFGLLALIALHALNWLADLFGSVSYDGASIAQVRQVWRRKKESALERVQGLPPSAQDLERLPFLRQIPPEIRKALLQEAQVRVFQEGQAIVHQNDRDRNLFVVLEGRLAVARTSTNAGSSRRKVVAWLDPGAVFGENAFFFAQPRSADIVGMEAGRLLVIPHTKDMKIIEAERSDELRTRIWFLQALVQSQFFKELPSDALDAILHAGVEQRFSAGTRVIQEGEEADACYFMVQGRASVTQKFKPVGKINAGDAFGEISILFPGTLRTATITADTDLLAIRIDRDKFWKLLKAHLPLALEIERLGLRRLKQDKVRGA
jgi:CRP-like cAMP-binding protein